MSVSFLPVSGQTPQLLSLLAGACSWPTPPPGDGPGVQFLNVNASSASRDKYSALPLPEPAVMKAFRCLETWQLCIPAPGEDEESIHPSQDKLGWI